jgi:type I restriction enzyme S subunit
MKEIDELEQMEKELEAIKAAFPADMKASLLQAAMEGKLTRQKAEDGDARGLLLAIREEKEKLVKEKKGKKEKPLAPITDEEIPFDIPDNWVWCRLGDLVFNHGQKKPDKTFSYIDVGTLDNVNHKLNKKENILEGKNAPSRARKIVKEGDVLYSTVRPYLHNICVIDRSFSHEPIASTAFAVMSCLDGLCNKYLYWSLLSPYFDAYANDPANSKGVAYPAINDTTFYNAIIPLPPLAEQHRIVEKLDQLLPLCDSLSEH